MGNLCFGEPSSSTPAAASREDVNIDGLSTDEVPGLTNAVASFEMAERNKSSMVSKLTKQQEDDSEEIFAVFEDDEDMVEVQHIGPMMRALNCKPTDEEIQDATNQLQTNGLQDDRMNFQQFIQVMEPHIIKANKVYNEEQMATAFNRFDVDGNGFISASELRTVLRDSFCTGIRDVAEELTDEDVEEVMAEADLNGDDKISYSEFQKMIPALSINIHTQTKVK